MTKTERIVATSEPPVEGIRYFIETETFGLWERLATEYRSANAAVAYARAFLNNWRVVEVSGV